MAAETNPVASRLLRHKGEISFLLALAGLASVGLARWTVPEALPSLFLILQHAFEAATVGGAADWLAVKMIFDEIKIGNLRIVPASGIVPRKQQAIARGAGQLVAREWLSKESLQRALTDMDFASPASDYVLAKTDAGIDWILDQVSTMLARQESKEALIRWLKEHAMKIRLSEWLARMATPGGVERAVRAIVPPIADMLHRGIGSPEVYRIVLEKMEAEQKGFFRTLFFDPVEATEKTILKAMEFLREVYDDESHPVRRKITEELLKWAEDVRQSGGPTALDEAVRDVALESDEWLGRMVDQIREWLVGQERDPASVLRQEMRKLARRVVERLRAEWKDPFNGAVREAIGAWLSQHHGQIAVLVEENLGRLSPEELKNQFKERTYDDMQWIRVNGAVAGFAVGAVIGVVRWWLG